MSCVMSGGGHNTAHVIFQTGMDDLNLKMVHHETDPSEECCVKKQRALFFGNVSVKKGEEG